MKRNMSTTDRSIRIIIAVVLIGLYAAGIVTGTMAIVSLVVASIFLVTSFINFCPLYRLLGISTLKKEERLKS
ncbi:MAG: DUF2892 domain-containing protein [Bacteroidetes bacterium]|nr:DUF2892 domain-containing protein [Bacteroidota bacterium]